MLIWYLIKKETVMVIKFSRVYRWKKITLTVDISTISLIKSLVSSAGCPQTTGVGCRAEKTSNCR